MLACQRALKMVWVQQEFDSARNVLRRILSNVTGSKQLAKPFGVGRKQRLDQSGYDQTEEQTSNVGQQI